MNDGFHAALFLSLSVSNAMSGVAATMVARNRTSLACQVTGHGLAAAAYSMSCLCFLGFFATIARM